MARLITLKIEFEVSAKNMGSTSTDSADDGEFMEDLITFAPLASGDSDCEIVSVSENKSRPEMKKKPHSNAQKKLRTESSYGKKDFYLPARFFDISRNKSLLSRCRALSVSIVDCGKFPWYYRKKYGMRKPRPKSKQIYTLQNLLEDMSFEHKLKQQKHEKQASEYKKCKEVIGKVNLTPSKDPNSVDFKKNIGLVGLKIERKLVGLVFDEKNKEDKRNKKHTTDKLKNKREGKETKNNSLEIEKNKASKDAVKPSELIIDRVNKIFVKESSLKCSLNLNPILSPSVQQKLLEIASKSAQHTTSTSIDAVQLLSSNIRTYDNTTIIGQTFKHINAYPTNVSTDDNISGRPHTATPNLQVALDKNILPSNQPAIYKNISVVENEIAKDAMPEMHDSKEKLIPNEVIKSDQLRIKSEPEIKQELKDEVVPDNALNENPTISVTHPNVEKASVSLLSNFGSFVRSIDNSLVPNQDVSEAFGQPISVQNSEVSNQNIVDCQWHQYNEAGLHGNLNYQQNSHLLNIPPMQPNVNNLQVNNQNVVADSTKSKVGDLKVQTVSQINNSIVTPETPPSEVVHNVPVEINMQNNELQFYRNHVIAQSKNNAGLKIPLLNAPGKKIVRVKNAYLMNTPNNKPNRHVAVGPYTVPPPHYQQFRYRPRMPNSGPVAQWPENTHLAHKMPILMQQLTQKQQPIQSQSFWEPSRTNQDFLYRNLSANPNQAYNEYCYNNWARTPQQPPPYVERRMKYVPPYARQKARLPNYISPNLKPRERGVYTQKQPEKTPMNQVTSLPALSPHISPLPGPQSTQCLNYTSQTLNTPVPTPSASVTNLPALYSHTETQTQTLSVPKPVQEVHTAEVLYPNTTFSEESSTSHVIYTEGSNHINETMNESTEHFLAQINTNEMPLSETRVCNEMTQAPIKFTKDNQKNAARAPHMPVLENIESIIRKPKDTANNVFSSQQQVKNSTPPENGLRKPNDTDNNVSSTRQQAINNTPPDSVLTKPNDVANNVLSTQLVSVLHKPNDADNNVLSSKQIVKNNTPKKLNPPAAPKKNYQIKNVPKKRPYIPNNHNKTPPFEGTASVCERSVPVVLERNVNNGYSPPILPIPTVQKSYEILALVNAIKTTNNEQNNYYNSGPLTPPVKHSDYRNNIDEGKSQVKPRKIITPNCIIENPPIRRKLNQTPKSATNARKISIDEYKKRQDNSKSIDFTDECQDRKNEELTSTKDKDRQKRLYTNNENRGVELQDLGYDSDPSSKCAASLADNMLIDS